MLSSQIAVHGKTFLNIFEQKLTKKPNSKHIMKGVGLPPPPKKKDRKKCCCLENIFILASIIFLFKKAEWKDE